MKLLALYVTKTSNLLNKCNFVPKATPKTSQNKSHIKNNEIIYIALSGFAFLAIICAISSTIIYKRNKDNNQEYTP